MTTSEFTEHLRQS